jgi:hypothetical protein
VEIYALKLKTGIDLIGEFVYSDENVVILKNPIELNINPEYGIFAKQWNNFIETEVIGIYHVDTYFVSKANKRASDYYSAYLQSQVEIEAELIKTKLEEVKPTRLN